MLSQLSFPNAGAGNELYAFLAGHYGVRLVFDAALTCSCIICAIIPGQRFFTILCLLAVSALFLLHLTNNGVPNAHPAWVLILFPFLALSDGNFSFLWKMYRVLICLLCLLAAVSLLLKAVAGIDGITYSAANWFLFNRPQEFLQQPEGEAVSPWLMYIGIGIGLFTGAGIFTRRYDRWILGMLILFCLVNLFVLGAGFVEQSLIFAAFLPWVPWAERLQISSSDD